MDPTKGDQSNTKACHGNCKYQPYILSCALQREYEEENCFNVFILPKQTSAKKRKKYVDFGTPPFHLGFPKSKATVFQIMPFICILFRILNILQTAYLYVSLGETAAPSLKCFNWFAAVYLGSLSSQKQADKFNKRMQTSWKANKQTS